MKETSLARHARKRQAMSKFARRARIVGYLLMLREDMNHVSVNLGTATILGIIMCVFSALVAVCCRGVL